MEQYLKSLSISSNRYCDKICGNLFETISSKTFSPLSAYLATLIVYLGSNNNTKTELQKLLQASNIDSELIIETRDLINCLMKNTTDILFCDSNLKIEEIYEKVLSHLDSAIFRGDFKNPVMACNEINSIISQKTKGMINDIVRPESFDELTRLIVVNTLYFKSKWMNPFPKKNTQKAPFTKSNGETYNIDMMHIPNDMIYYFENDKLQLVQKNYNDNAFTMGFILFKGEFDSNLISFETLDRDYIDETDLCSVKLSIPKFKQESSLDMRGVMCTLGVNDLFNMACDLSNLTNEQVYVTNVVQKVVVSIDEEETVAAAATAIFAKRGLSSIHKRVIFNANRTFMYYIRHIPTRVILFNGIYDGQ